jgi:antirestriction protein ArdC
MNTERIDIYTRITNQIAEAIENGEGRYRMPWHATAENSILPINALSERPYRGVNVLALWSIAEKLGYESSLWATYRQWQKLGAQVRKGESGSAVVVWKIAGQEEDDGAEEGSDRVRDRARMFARTYWVFNVAQVDGYHAEPTPKLPEEERIGRADVFFSELGVSIEHGGNQPCYDRTNDVIRMPRFEDFKDALGYYSVLSHEATHWTGAPKRLNRDLSHRFGSEAYAMEELIAELGAAFLCASLGLSLTPRPDHAGYAANWLRVLRNDKRAIFTAATKAQQAVDWMQDQVLATLDRVA